MLTRIQIKAEGPTANAVESDLRYAAARIISEFELSGDLNEHVVFESAGDKYVGRMSLNIAVAVTA